MAQDETASPAYVIAFEGIDGSGKTTTIAATKTALEKLGKTVKVFKFPNKETKYGERIYNILHGKEQFDINKNKIEFAKLFIRDRKLAQPALRQAIEDFDFVLLDRYILTNAVYTASIAESMLEEDRMEIVRQLLIAESEENLNHITPHINLLLNISIVDLMKNINERKVKDKYENVTFLCRCDGIYKQLINPKHIIPYIRIEDRIQLVLDIITNIEENYAEKL